MKLTFAFCTYNRASRLPSLVAAMRYQQCPVPFEILTINNNSTNDTLTKLHALAAQPGAPLRIVTELSQNIVPARNRAIEESLDSDVQVFIDDDELPQPGMLMSAYDALTRESAHSVGGHEQLKYAAHERPSMLGEK